MRNLKIILGILFFLIVGNLVGQESLKLVVQTHVFNDGIAIRWTPGDIKLWREWSRYGYHLERYTIAKNGVQITDGESVLIGGGVINPHVDSSILDNSKTQLLSSCLESKRDITSKADLLQRIEEDNNCYIFSMLSLQRDFKLTMAAGLGIIDYSTKNAETYLYKLYPVNSPIRDTQVFVVNAGQYTEMPEINNLSTTFSGGKILLEWKPPGADKIYHAFRVERSLDSGLTYQSVDSTFLLYSNDAPQLYLDTPGILGEPIFYRVKGVNYFGLLSQASQSVSIVVYPFTEAYPQFLETFTASNNSLGLRWSFDSLERTKIKGFRVCKSDSIMGLFIPLDTSLYKSDIKEILLPEMMSESVYLKVVAVTKNNTQMYSHPLLIQQVDSFPPDVPVFANSLIDSNGLVTLNWNSCQSSDFMAYRVYKGNTRSHEFSLISTHYFNDTFFYDTLPTNMLNDSVFYKVTAVDKRYNESQQSAACSLMTKNNILPDVPVIYEASSIDSGIQLHWYKSNNLRVVKYVLKRSSMASAEKKVYDINFRENEFIDTTVKSGETYSYTLEAVTDNGRYSGSANPIVVKMKHRHLMPEVKVSYIVNDSAKYCVTIFWDYEFDNDVSHYKVLALGTDMAYHTIGTANGGQLFFNHRYWKTSKEVSRFMVVAYFKDGRRSKL
ncbi:MAG: hypothetical protein V4613_00695 [Bacteroidota bacterium]